MNVSNVFTTVQMSIVERATFSFASTRSVRCVRVFLLLADGLKAGGHSKSATSSI